MTLPAIEWVDAAVCATLLQDNSSIHTHVHTYICTCNFRQTPTPHQLHSICIKKPNAGIYLSILFLRNKKKGEHKKKLFATQHQKRVRRRKKFYWILTACILYKSGKDEMSGYEIIYEEWGGKILICEYMYTTNSISTSNLSVCTYKTNTYYIILSK